MLSEIGANDIVPAQTYIGNIVVAMNPYAVLEEKLGEHRIGDYRSKPREELPPHLYALAHNAFTALPAPLVHWAIENCD